MFQSPSGDSLIWKNGADGFAVFDWNRFQSPSGDSLIWKPPPAPRKPRERKFQSPSGDSLIWKCLYKLDIINFIKNVSVPFRGFFNLKVLQLLTLLPLNQYGFQSPSGDSLIWKASAPVSVASVVAGFQSPSGDSLIWKNLMNNQPLRNLRRFSPLPGIL